jgi:hypothetical protein
MQNDRKPKRHQRQVIGVIHLGAVYDTDAVLEYTCLGEVALRELRMAGRLAGRGTAPRRVWLA